MPIRLARLHEHTLASARLHEAMNTLASARACEVLASARQWHQRAARPKQAGEDRAEIWMALYRALGRGHLLLELSLWIVNHGSDILIKFF